jgi:hypothetical protein
MTGWGFSYASLFTRTIQTRRRWFLSGADAESLDPTFDK